MKTSRFDELLVAVGVDPTKDLVGADLRGANFDGSVIDGWNLSRCDLTSASFNGARIRNLITTDAIGLDLSGSKPLQDEENEDTRTPEDTISWLIEQIVKSTRGQQRWPFLERLLKSHEGDKRVWEFLLTHIKRERVGKFVSRIIIEWETNQSSAAAGDELRLKLLRPGGSPHITVRARLLREVASRIGPQDSILEIAKSMIEMEGYWTSGLAAMSVLAEVFRGDDQAAKILKEAILQQHWFGSKPDAVSALLEGFGGPDAREVVESAILTDSFSEYTRAGMLQSYARSLPESSLPTQLARRLFGSDQKATIRASALEVLTRSGNISDSGGSKGLLVIASEDRDGEVRATALRALYDRGDVQIAFLLKRATQDEHHSARAMAIHLLEYLGYQDEDWFIQVFANDAEDSVRGYVLSWLLSDKGVKDRFKLRKALLREIARKDPSYAAGRAAKELMVRWPDDDEVLSMVRDLRTRLPKNTGGWNDYLGSILRQYI